ncbi:MAG TPA: SAM-dependent methyltransferase [Rhodopila sp.]|nr:SAM-dependent methyltransferase [Rhodopila sp.]
MDDDAALEEEIRRLIAIAGPMPVAEYMRLCLTHPQHGYYTTGDPFGRDGDFTTAPEISQLFGELIGAWLIDCWDQAGRPERVNLVELGPGRGTLMADMTRVARHVPEWLKAVQIHLVEINPRLRQAQAASLAAHAPQWHESFATMPDGPVMLVANEFLDALPIRQLVFRHGAWRERLVDWNAETGFHFAPSAEQSPLSLLVPPGLSPTEGAVYELSPAVISVATEVARRIAVQGGAALFIDYGRSESALGESLQAVRAHRMVEVLDSPGEADLSAHVDFALLGRVAHDAGAAIAGPVPQGAFLNTLGIGIRAQRLRRGLSGDTAGALDQAVARLTAPEAMGQLFKVLAIVPPGGIRPAGFGTA